MCTKMNLWLKWQIPNVGKAMGNYKYCDIANRDSKWNRQYGKKFVDQKLQHDLLHDSAISQLGLYTKALKCVIVEQKHTQTFTAALLVIEKGGNSLNTQRVSR